VLFGFSHADFITVVALFITLRLLARGVLCRDHRCRWVLACRRTEARPVGAIKLDWSSGANHTLRSWRENHDGFVLNIDSGLSVSQ
jgi:hypothetical protein